MYAGGYSDECLANYYDGYDDCDDSVVVD